MPESAQFPDGPPAPQRTTLHCPCGEWIQGRDEDHLVELAREHLAAAHPGRTYSRDEILSMAL